MLSDSYGSEWGYTMSDERPFSISEEDEDGNSNNLDFREVVSHLASPLGIIRIKMEL